MQKTSCIDDIVCNVPNVKDGPDIQLRYSISAKYYKIYKELGISGMVHNEGGQNQIGSFVFKVTQDKIDIKEYFPIGSPSIPKQWKGENRDKGISQTFLFWLSRLAMVNGVGGISISSPWIHNYYVFRKYFADEIKIVHMGSKSEWRSFESFENTLGQSLYSYETIGSLEVRDVMTLVPTAYVSLEKCEGRNGEYKIISAENNRSRLVRLAMEDNNVTRYTPERYADELVEGIIINIDNMAFVRIGNKIIGVVARPIGGYELVVRGKPKIPDSVNKGLNAETIELDLPGVDFKFKYLASKC